MGATKDVFVHSGELRYQELDLVIKGRGFDFRWVRTYRSRIDYNGPLGVEWDFSYNNSISKDGADALVKRRGAHLSLHLRSYDQQHAYRREERKSSQMVL